MKKRKIPEPIMGIWIDDLELKLVVYKTYYFYDIVAEGNKETLEMLDNIIGPLDSNIIEESIFDNSCLVISTSESFREIEKEFWDIEKDIYEKTT